MRLLQTLHALNNVAPLTDGTVPLAVWLQNAVMLAKLRPEKKVFERALAEVSSRAHVATSAFVVPLMAEPIHPAAALAAFDLGTTWGLTRGRIVGLVAGFPGAPLFDTLVAVEALVFESAARAAVALPSRWWFRLPFASPQAEPSDEAALRELLASIERGPRGSWLTEHGWPKDTRLGVVIEVSLESQEQWRRVEAALCSWVARLVRLGAPGRGIDVVVHVQSRTRVTAEAAVRWLYGDLVAGLPFPVDSVRLRDAPTHEESVADGGGAELLASLGVRSEATETSPGGELGRWLSLALHSLLKEPNVGSAIEEIRQRHPKVIELINRLHVKNKADALGPAASVLAQLDELNHQDGVDAELLSFVHTVLPGHVKALLRAYGTGVRAAGQRAALQFAARSPAYVDAYVDGALASGRFPKMDELSAAPGAGGAFAADVLRGLLRRRADERAGPHIAAFSSLIELLGLDEAPPPLLPVTNDPASIWRILAEPITRDRLAAILRAKAAVRAAFGLVSEGEWVTLAADPHFRRRLLELRADRALIFELPAPSAGEGSS